MLNMGPFMVDCPIKIIKHVDFPKGRYPLVMTKTVVDGTRMGREWDDNGMIMG